MSLVKRVSRRKVLGAGAVVVGAASLMQPNGGLIPSAFAQAKKEPVKEDEGMVKKGKKPKTKSK